MEPCSVWALLLFAAALSLVSAEDTTHRALTSLSNPAQPSLLPCPAPGQEKNFSVDPSVHPESLFSDGTPTARHAASLAECRTMAGFNNCTSGQANFYLYYYSAQGTQNCFYGTPCVAIPTGSALVTAGTFFPPRCPPIAPIPCPPSSRPSTISIDPRGLSPFFTRRTFGANSASECSTMALDLACRGYSGDMYLYSAAGFPNALGDSLGTCAVGVYCANITRGVVQVQAGSTLKHKCPRTVPCPTARKPTRSILVDNTTFAPLGIDNYFFHFYGYAFNWESSNVSEADCISWAQGFSCATGRNGYYLHSPSVLNVGRHVLTSNCGFMYSCSVIKKGNVSATLGLVQPRCPPSPPPSPPPPVNTCVGAVSRKNKCSCPKFSVCVKSVQCNNKWVCKCQAPFSNLGVLPYSDGELYCF